jgi:hypothetical protein
MTAALLDDVGRRRSGAVPVRTRATQREGLRPRLRRAPAAGLPDDIVDQWGLQSFPASDPPSNW